MQHVGLGEALLIDSVHVVWPGGAARTLHNLSSNRTWTLYPADALGDGDANGTVDPADAATLAACMTALPTVLEPGCEMMDFNGDGVLNCSDWNAFDTASAGAAPPLPFAYADVDGSAVVDLADILCAVDGFAGAAACAADVAPCGGDSRIDIDDVIAVLDTFAGRPLCATACE